MLSKKSDLSVPTSMRRREEKKFVVGVGNGVKWPSCHY